MTLVIGMLFMLLSCGKNTRENEDTSASVASQVTVTDESSEDESVEEAPENVTVEYKSDEVIEIH